VDDLEHLHYKEALLPFGDPDASDPDPDVRKRFFGKYRASVITNVDPLEQGRLILRIPDVFGLLPSNWALPCVPMAGPSMGTSFIPPPVGASVWAEFEQGDPQSPIWVGCFWETPFTLGTMAKVSGLTATPAVTLETLTSGVGVSDTPTLPPGGGSACIYTALGAISIVLNPAGITITAPTVKILSPSFTVNGAQFSVT
jgi:type VI secretion system (T6SS) baseplate-like injector VgrG